MICPIKKPKLQEVESLPVYWLTNNEVWDSSYFDEMHKSTDIVPQGYGCTRGIINLSKSSTKVPDATLLSKFFLYRPVEVIKHTLSCTTRLATSMDELNMRRHYKSRIPMLNRPRIHETYATETWFANTRAIGGYTCAQIFYGTKSRFIVLYPMKREGNGPQILEDFIRDHGAPFTIRSDNSQMQSGTLWSSICRKYNIAHTEPNHPHQNPAERYIGHVKGLVSTIRDRTGAPDKLWALCAIYVVYILNRMAYPLLENRTPFEVRHGYTPDISAIVHFSFWDKIYYLDSESSFPKTKEKEGRFVGFTEHVGDALTYWILDLASQQLLARSVIRLATTTNERADTTAAVSFSTSTPLLVGHAELTPNADMIVFDPLDHTGYDDKDITMLPMDNPTPTSDLSTIHIGTKLSVYWPDDDKFYQGTITSISPSGLYHVSYDDGDFEELDLHKERFIITPSSTPPMPDNQPDMDIDTTPGSCGKRYLIAPRIPEVSALTCGKLCSDLR